MSFSRFVLVPKCFESKAQYALSDNGLLWSICVFVGCRKLWTFRILGWCRWLHQLFLWLRWLVFKWNTESRIYSWYRFKYNFICYNTTTNYNFKHYIQFESTLLWHMICILYHKVSPISYHFNQQFFPSTWSVATNGCSTSTQIHLLFFPLWN